MNNIFDNKIKAISNIELSTTAFLTVGAAALAVPFGYAAMGAAVVPLVSAMFSIINRKAIVNNSFARLLDHGITGPLYTRALVNNMTDFIDSAPSLTEKKYRAIFSFLWLESKNIKMTNFFDYEKVDKWSEEISVETKIDLFGLFNNSKNAKTLDSYFKDDQARTDAKERLEIAKNVFENFSQSGMLGRLMKSYYFDRTQIVAQLQDYKLSAEDIVEIKKITNYNKKMGAALINSPLDLIDLHENKEKYLYELITHNSEHKDILKDFFKSYDDINGLKGTAPGAEFIEYLEDYHAKKSRYDNLQEILGEKPVSEKPARKIKI